jgi:hypothetical protein
MQSTHGTALQTSTPEDTKVDKAKPDIQKQLDTFIATRLQNYVAHALWDEKAVDGVMKIGSVKSSEDLLRSEGQVSYEASDYGHRGTQDIRALLADLKEKKITPPSSPLRLIDSINISDAKKIGLITDATYKELIGIGWVDDIYDENGNYIKTIRNLDKIKSNLSLKLNDGNEYKVIYDPMGIDSDLENTCFRLQGVPYLELQDMTKYNEFINQLAWRYNCSRMAVQICLDQNTDISSHHHLARVWNTCKPLVLNSDYRGLTHELMAFYHHQFDSKSKLQATIFAGYNGIWWSYGDVVVLRANPKQLLSEANRVSNYNPHLPSELKELQPEKLRDITLLYPYENKGEFFRMDLSHPDTIMIGPRAKLVRYQERAREMKLQMFFIEDMTEKQQQFFDVPFRLKPKARAAGMIGAFFEKRIQASQRRVFDAMRVSLLDENVKSLTCRNNF